MPGIISGITMVFVPAVFYLLYLEKLGGTNNTMIGDVIELQFKRGSLNQNLGAAMSLILMVLVFISIWLMNRFTGEGDEGYTLRKGWTYLDRHRLHLPLRADGHTFIGSFNDGKDLSEFEGFTFDNYADLFRNSHLLGLLLTSLILAVCAAALATVLRHARSPGHTGYARQAAQNGHDAHEHPASEPGDRHGRQPGAALRVHRPQNAEHGEYTG